MDLSTSKIKALIFLLLLVVVLHGCKLLKTTAIEMDHSCFVCNKGDMVGNTTLILKDSTFTYSERGGLYDGNGKWHMSSDGKYLILNGVSTLANCKGTEIELKKEINIKLKIKGKDKLIGDGCIFIRK